MRRLARFHRAYAEVRDRDGVAHAGFLDPLDRVLPVTEVVHVRHEEREACLRDEVEPVALRGLVGRFRHADVERHLGVLIHGRAPAVGTAIKRGRPDSILVSYQGDGDLSAIGSSEILHAANRGENITAIFVNNAIYSMTGGQCAPTTLIGQKSTTTPNGRNAASEGYPLRVSELLATLEAPAYIARVGLGDNKQIAQADKAIRKAVETQEKGLGFSLVEILSP